MKEKVCKKCGCVYVGRKCPDCKKAGKRFKMKEEFYENEMIINDK